MTSTSPVMLLLGLALSCVTEPEPLPTQVRVSAADARMNRAGQPPLYQMLYDYAFLPNVQHKEQITPNNEGRSYEISYDNKRGLF